MKFGIILLLCTSILISAEKYRKCLHNQEIKYPEYFYVDEYSLPIKIEVSNRISHQLVSHILRILLSEVIGYENVTLIKQEGELGDNATVTMQKIASCHSPTNCTKINAETGPEITINAEVWFTPRFNLDAWIETGEIDVVGRLGPIGRSGWYMPEYTVKYFWKANNTVVDHWRAFKVPEIVAHFSLSKEVLDPLILGKKYCSHKDCGEDGVYRPKKCLQPNVRCATLLADYPASNFELLKKQITELELLVNVLWIGDQLLTIVDKRIRNSTNILFFHKKPMYLSALSKFVHVTFPDCEDKPASSCDLEVSQIKKVAWSKIKSNAFYAHYVLKSLFFSQEDYLKLIKKYVREQHRRLPASDIACTWLRENTEVWDNWYPGDSKNKTKIYIGGIFPLSGAFRRHSGVIAAAQMAAAAINGNDKILSNYNLTILEQDGHCSAHQVMNSFINYIANDTFKTMVGILGPACSDTLEPIAGFAKYRNTVIISYSADGAYINDRDKFPYFFRTTPENNQFRYVFLKLFKELGFSSVAALTEDGQKYSEYLSYLHDEMQERGMEFLANRKFPRQRGTKLNMKTYLQDLIDKNAKIIIGDFYDYAARAIMCEAYHLGMTAKNGYVWFLPMFSSKWYGNDNIDSNVTDDFESVDCSTEQMFEAINGHMSLAFKYYADPHVVMQEDKTVQEWRDHYERVVKSYDREASDYGGYTYDAVWVYALALDALLKENNSNIATLHTSKTTRRLVEHINNTDFNGVSGHVSFVGSSRISDVIIWQWINHTFKRVGVYEPSSQTDGTLKLEENAIVWLTPNGKKPADSTKKKEKCSVEALKEFLNVECGVAILAANIIGLSIFGLLVLFGIVFFKRRFDKRMKITEERMKELGLMANSSPFPLDEWEMPRDHIVINRKLGEGAFGTVYGGEAHIKDKGWIAVAVKTLKNGAKPEEKLDFLSEAEIMKQFDHINIVKLVGVCTMGEPVYTVMEFMLYGDLKTYLLSRRNIATEKDRTVNDEVSDKRLTNMGLDIARGLSYLADKKYVHRDLACRNCLVNIARSVKIADFGMCRAMYDSDYYRYNKKGMLPVRWMAPESLTDGLFTPMSDVWSYGVVLYEIITFASVPYQGLSNAQVLERIKNHKTLSPPKGCNPELYSLLMKCWSITPQERPQAVDVVEILAQNPELISPCLDLPRSSVEILDTGSCDIAIPDRVRGHSLTAVWQNCKNVPSSDQSEVKLVDSPHVSIYRYENNFNRKLKKERRKEKIPDISPQMTPL